jgi:hypothetical protein
VLRFNYGHTFKFAALLATDTRWLRPFGRRGEIRASLNTLRDLILKTVALRDLGLLGRSDRRFRPCDRLLWLCLQRLWRPVKKAFVLVKPATVVGIAKASLDPVAVNRGAS